MTPEVNERIELFKKELSYITDDELKRLLKNILAMADDYFFTVPASSSGKYHPDFARGEGGLVRHTKSVAYFTDRLVRAELQAGTIDRHKGDLLIVAAVAHDIKKQGDGSGKHTVSEHPKLGADFVKSIAKRMKFPQEDIDFLYSVMESHMGPWGDPKPQTLEQRILFYADYVSSSKEIVGLSFIESGDNSEVPPPPKMTIEDYRFDFGKHAGKSLEEVYATTPDYLDWILKKEDFSHDEVKQLVREFVEKKNKQKPSVDTPDDEQPF